MPTIDPELIKKQILAFLRTQPYDVPAIAVKNGVKKYSMPTILKYLSILEAEGKVVRRDVGTATLYKLARGQNGKKR